MTTSAPPSRSCPSGRGRSAQWHPPTAEPPLAEYDVPPAIESSTIVVLLSELDEQRKIAEALEPLNHPLKCAPDLRAVVAVYRSAHIGLVVTPDIRIPFEKQYVVEGIPRESLRIPEILLVDEPG